MNTVYFYHLLMAVVIDIVVVCYDILTIYIMCICNDKIIIFTVYMTDINWRRLLVPLNM